MERNWPFLLGPCGPGNVRPWTDVIPDHVYNLNIAVDEEEENLRYGPWILIFTNTTCSVVVV